jgi:hypothetical protein
VKKHMSISLVDEHCDRMASQSGRCAQDLVWLWGPCKSHEKNWSLTVGSDRNEKIKESGCMGTIWYPGGNQGGYGMWSK